jgi:hypothetical protein
VRLVSVAERQSCEQHPRRWQTEKLADGFVPVRPCFLRTGVQTRLAREQHHRLHEHTQVYPLRWPHLPIDQHEHAYGSVPELEVAGDEGLARGLVLAADVHGAVHVLATLEPS